MTHSNIGAPKWIKIEMLEEAQVESLYIQNREECCADKIKTTTVSIGNSKNIEENPTCTYQVNGSSLFGAVSRANTSASKRPIKHNKTCLR